MLLLPSSLLFCFVNIIFKKFASCLYFVILDCILLMRHEHIVVSAFTTIPSCLLVTNKASVFSL
jgi:hypothetical protein